MLSASPLEVCPLLNGEGGADGEGVDGKEGLGGEDGGGNWLVYNNK